MVKRRFEKGAEGNFEFNLMPLWDIQGHRIAQLQATIHPEFSVNGHPAAQKHNTM